MTDDAYFLIRVLNPGRGQWHCCLKYLCALGVTLRNEMKGFKLTCCKNFRHSLAHFRIIIFF